MKNTSALIAGLALALSAFSFAPASAQLAGEPPVKVVPTLDKGILKVIYAHNSPSVEVKFYDAQGLMLTDRIKGSAAQGGFMKRYDIRNLKSNSYWVEITSPELSVTYKVDNQGKESSVPVLESTTYRHAMVAKN
jgi:hypothetical protein